LIGGLFDDIINFVILLLGNLIIDNDASKEILINDFTLINIIGEFVQDEHDEKRVDILKNSVWLFSNLVKSQNVSYKVVLLS
jgi:hypothetical protein